MSEDKKIAGKPQTPMPSVEEENKPSHPSAGSAAQATGLKPKTISQMMKESADASAAQQVAMGNASAIGLAAQNAFANAAAFQQVAQHAARLMRAQDESYKYNRFIEEQNIISRQTDFDRIRSLMTPRNSFGSDIQQALLHKHQTLTAEADKRISELRTESEKKIAELEAVIEKNEADEETK